MKMGHGFVLAMMLEENCLWETAVYDPAKAHDTKVLKRKIKAPENSDTSLFISGIPQGATLPELTKIEEALKVAFSAFKVVSLDVKRDKRTGAPKGFAFIDFTCSADQQKALATVTLPTGLEMKIAQKKQWE